MNNKILQKTKYILMMIFLNRDKLYQKNFKIIFLKKKRKWVEG